MNRRSSAFAVLGLACVTLGCDQRTGVFLHIQSSGVAADRLRISATSAAATVTREVDQAGGIHFPATLVARFPDDVGAVSFALAATQAGVATGSATLAAAPVPPHQLVDRDVTLTVDGLPVGDMGLPNLPPSYTRPLSVPRGQVRSLDGSPTLADYPLPFVLSDPTLRSVASGGHVALDDGSDIYFTASGETCKGAASCLLDSELERYDATSGQLSGWVRVPSLNLSPASSDTVITLHYGNATQPPVRQPARVWDASFRAVWHLDDTAVADSSAGAHAGKATAVAAVAGQMGGALSFDGNKSFVEVADAAALDFGVGSDFTISMWVRSTQAGTPRLVSKRDPASGSGYDVLLHGNGGSDRWAGAVATPGGLTLAPGRSNVADGNWHFVAFVRAGATLTAYEDVSPAAPVTSDGGDLGNALALRLGAAGGASASNLFAGALDEVRISATARSANWIEADYGLQKAPGAAVTMGAEVAPP